MLPPDNWLGFFLSLLPSNSPVLGQLGVEMMQVNILNMMILNCSLCVFMAWLVAAETQLGSPRSLSSARVRQVWGLVGE